MKLLLLALMGVILVYNVDAGKTTLTCEGALTSITENWGSIDSKVTKQVTKMSDKLQKSNSKWTKKLTKAKVKAASYKPTKDVKKEWKRFIFKLGQKGPNSCSAQIHTEDTTNAALNVQFQCVLSDVQSAARK